MPDETNGTHGAYETGLNIGVEPEQQAGRYLSVADVNTSARWKAIVDHGAGGFTPA